MKNSISKTKMTATIAIFLLLGSVALMAMPAQAQYGYWYPPPEPTNVQDPGSLTSIPAGVTPGFTLKLDPYLSFRPNPVGVGQTVLVNIWTVPGPALTRYFSDLKVTITKPDGTVDVKVMDSYMADSTAWFEYVVDQVGEWKFKFDFPGAYFPAGNYTLPTGTSRGGFTESYSVSCWYKPASTAEQTLTVQEDMVYSWPESAIPTDYWTRPVQKEHREWWTILGNYPWFGPSGGSTWDELYPDTTSYYNARARFTPWVQAPNTAHIAWKRLDALSGILGGDNGYVSRTTGGNTPEIVFQGRAYNAITKVYGGISQSVWTCTDFRTGEVIWERTGVAAPSYIEYGEGLPSVPGATAAVGITPALVAISGNRLIKYDPSTGAASVNVSIPSFTTTMYYMNGYALSVQTLSNTGNENLTEHEGGAGSAGSATAGVYRLINWTTFGTSSNFNERIVSNISWPRASLGVTQDFSTGMAFESREANFFDLANMGYPYVDTYYDNATGVRYGNRIKAYNLVTGEEVWDITVGESQFSSSSIIADHGKIVIVMQDAGPNNSGGGYLMCWDQITGKLLWKSEQMEYPWDVCGFGAYGIASAYGVVLRPAYSGIYAFDWDTGKIAWKYEAPAFSAYETPYVDEDGNTVYSWYGSTMQIADGKLYIQNSEHSISQPVTRGWGLHCINMTTGELIWTTKMAGSSGAISDGYLSVSGMDGYMYVYGKGKSETTVTAAPKTLAQGDQILIEGTVLDMSLAQPNTPCVSADSMTTQMEYLHNQMPIAGLWGNETITGVPVVLSAIDANGNLQDIGTATTNGYYGTFSYAWTPPIEGTYTIMANFLGDGSYVSSGAATAITVGPAPVATATPEPPQAAPDTTLTIIGTGIAIIIAVAIVGILVLRKRQ